MSIETIIKQDLSKAGGSIFTAPNIPEKKLNNAISSITKGTLDPDYVIAIVDTTILSNCKNGFVFSGDSLYYRGLMGEPKHILLSDMKEVKVDVTKTQKKDGSYSESKRLIIINKEDNKILDISDVINYEVMSDLLNKIISLGNDENTVFENKNQVIPLSECSTELKIAYVKLVCNFAFSDDGKIDEKEYSEIYSLMVRNNFSPENRIIIRNYIVTDDKDDSKLLIEQINKELKDGNFDVICKSLIKDMLYVYHKKGMELFSWKDNKFLTDMSETLKIDEKQVDLLCQAIKNDEDIILKRKSDTEIQKNMKDIIAKAGAVGVPIAAVYFSGSVVGLSAAGITSGLAALGMGGVLGFSSMVTGIGLAVVIGLTTYKGLKKLTGGKDLENNKQREMMIQVIIKNLQRTTNYLIEDVNFISSELIKAIENQNKDEEKINKLKQLMQLYSKASAISSTDVILSSKELILTKLPKTLDKMRFDELTNEPTKQKLRPFVYKLYEEKKEDVNGKVKVTYVLNYNQDLEVYEKLYQILDNLTYFKLSSALVANTKGIASKGLESLKNSIGI